MNIEKNIHQSICAFIRRLYPDVIFMSDASGLRVSQGLRMQMKTLKSSRGIPDLIILHPVGKFCGLMLEIKTVDAPLYRRDGELVADPHIHEQSDVLMHLRDLGYAAFFVRGFDRAVSCFQNYITNSHRINDVKRSELEWDDRMISTVRLLNRIKTAKI
jgi:hypothetical protein